MQHIRTRSVLRTAKPSRVAVDEKQITVADETKWLYAAIDTDSKLLSEVDVFSRRGTDPASGFLHRLTQKHDVSRYRVSHRRRPVSHGASSP
jgi:transposase-like protein